MFRCEFFVLSQHSTEPIFGYFALLVDNQVINSGESVYQPDGVDCDLTWTAMPTSLYVGIDLGTTFTGVVYACPPLRTIHTISEWPGTDNNEAKVPTRLFYDNDKLVGWGFAHPGHDTKGNKGRGQEISVVERFKLAIDPALSVSPDTARPMPSSVSKWYKDFLKCLYEHISFLLQALQPQAWSQEVEFMFSIPNLYGPHIIAKFRDFIQSAGFDGGRHHVSIVSLTESQAAIVYASHSLSVFKVRHHAACGCLSWELMSRCLERRSCSCL